MYSLPLSDLTAIIVLFTCEAEYMAAGSRSKEALWWAKVLDDYSLATPDPISILIESQSSLARITTGAVNNASKHINVVYHATRMLLLRRKGHSSAPTLV
jgi:hypothetical protein